MKKQVKVEFAKESHKLQLDLFDDGENVSRIVSVVRSDGVIYGDAFKTMYDKDRRKGYGRYLLEYFLKYIKENYKGMTLLIYAVPFVTDEEWGTENVKKLLESVPSKKMLIDFYKEFGLSNDKEFSNKMTMEL